MNIEENRCTVDFFTQKAGKIQILKKFLSTLAKRTYIYSHRALPHDVTDTVHKTQCKIHGGYTNIQENRNFEKKTSLKK